MRAASRACTGGVVVDTLRRMAPRSMPRDSRQGTVRPNVSFRWFNELQLSCHHLCAAVVHAASARS